MKKSLILFSLLIVVIVSFVGGARFNQHGAGQNNSDTNERQILHYVDPMNPGNISQEPGIAPCGMPMEPVYSDEDTLGGSAILGTLGSVRINEQKQQIIGVQIGKVTRATETAKIRALGRIVPDENKVYALVAATDGWMGEIHESTTGSLVSKNQLLGKIKVYDYDFFTWQQRYLTELGNAGRRTVFLSNTSGAEEQMKKVASAQMKGGAILPDIGAPIALPSKTSTPWGIPPGATQYGVNPPSTSLNDPALPNEKVPELPTGPVPDLPTGPVPEMPMDPDSDLLQNEESQLIEQMPSMATMATPPSIAAAIVKPSPETSSMNSSKIKQKGPQHHPEMEAPATEMSPAKPAVGHSQPMKKMPSKKSGGLFFTAEDDVLYASKARQELLDFGVVESQFSQLAKTGVYLMYVELRSPVDGLVLSRNVTTLQRISQGAECFRVADLSRVWIETDIYDLEAEYIQPGMAAMVSMPNMTKRFAATVSEVPPEYDATGRSLKVRLELDNPGYMFRPDMFVDVEFILDLPQSMSVPSGAVIDSGKRKTVYVAMGEGIFEPREVETGWRFNSRIEIVRGLKQGERIVVSGNFLIDSESRMKLAAVRLMDDPLENPAKNTVPQIPEQKTIQPAKTIIATPSTVKDPICGMNIDPNKAIEEGLVIEAEGKTYYFCTEECALEFHRHGPQPKESADTDQMPDMSHDPGKQADNHMNMNMDMGNKP